ncbi:unnamed protein product [Bursaphelenchus okinawaensis]|uniref:ARMC9 CTLH-like domain-containing protein n=1 Tax=Bursaphelenchus okinawaensis TaxID=465554 RepID=A0A811KHC6_9BILA|nr:unnamed protein product [Bursaphelenchus okinawaensis]CAG9102946.1 unnamed protein product [Bursaphelenchus okinawaensis]
MSGVYAVESTKELIKQYFNNVKYFSQLAAKQKDQQLQVDTKLQVERIVSEIVKYIDTYDIDSLNASWEYFSTHLFNNLTEMESKTLNKLEADIFKLYLANCAQNKKTEKSVQFFEKMGHVITNNPLWTDWFCVPYLPDPASDKRFCNYFCKTFHEILLTTLHNFISISLSKLCKPPLVGYCQGIEESDDYTLQARTQASQQLQNSMVEMFMDDFSIIAKSSEKAKAKPTIKTMFKSFTRRSSDGS